MYVVVYRGVKSAGLGIATPRFWTGGSWGSQGVVHGVVKYCHVLSCRPIGSMFESGDLEEK